MTCKVEKKNSNSPVTKRTDLNTHIKNKINYIKPFIGFETIGEHFCMCNKVTHIK